MLEITGKKQSSDMVISPSVNKPKLSIIIVSWNCLGYLTKCLNSILSSSISFPLEIIIIDNASSDGTVEVIKSAYPLIKLIANQSNLGFPRACNQGLKASAGSFLLLLNPDTELHPETLEKSINFLERHPEIGLMGVKIKRPDGRIQLHGGRAFPSLFSLLSNSLGLDRAFPSLKIFSSPDLTFWDHSSSQEVDMISGTFMLFPRQVYEELGGLDERLPLFFEDMEYCWRVKQSGRKIYYLAETEIIHHSGISSTQAPSFWITSLKYEANRLMLRHMGRGGEAALYPLLIFLLSPGRWLLFPFWRLAQKKKGIKVSSHIYLAEVVQAWLWSTKILALFLFARLIKIIRISVSKK